MTEKREICHFGNHSNKLPKVSAENAKYIRVVKRNLIYIYGLPKALLKVEILKREEFFGQYGAIKSIDICPGQKSVKKQSSDVVYITFATSLEASLAILSSNNFQVNNKQIKVCFGMTNLC